MRMNTQQRILAILKSHETMTRGVLSVTSVSKTGRKYYNLQYHRKAKYFAKSVSKAELPYYERSTEVYRIFIKLVQKYIDEETKRGIKAIAKETKHARREKRKAR